MEAPARQTASQTLPPVLQIGRRRLIVRDSLKFLILTLTAVVLGGVTALLFRSFEARREALALQWAEMGRDALRQGHPAQAVDAFHVSLSYHPDDTLNELALAQALAASGHVGEAESYFLNLWQARPGDGPINLQLARLARSKGDSRSAVDYYQAAVVGTWAGDAVPRRRDTRLELAKYLIDRGQLQAARAELAVAAGNIPDGASQLAVAQLLEQAGDTRDALVAYRNAENSDATRNVAQAKAGELCYRAGDYACAADLLEKALLYPHWTTAQEGRMSGLKENAVRLQELSFEQDLPSSTRTTHLLTDARLAQTRLRDCTAAQANMAPALAPLQAQWKDLDSAKNRAALRHDDDLQEQFGALILQTERSASAVCGAPTGDDALLLQLRDHPATHAGAQTQ